MRPLTRFDRARVLQSMDEWCSTGSIVALRTRALILLAGSAGLRVSECTALDLVQLLEDPKAGTMRLRESFYLRPDQAKGGEVGAGMVTISRRARSAVRVYIAAVRRADWVGWPAAPHAPLFLGHRRQRGQRGHDRLSVRSAQHSWYEVQKRARITTRYGFHSLRHDAASRLREKGADVFDLMKQFRWRDLNHAQRYVHEIDAQRRLPALVNAADKR